MLKAYGIAHKSPDGEFKIRQIWSKEETCDKHLKKWQENSTKETKKVIFTGEVVD